MKAIVVVLVVALTAHAASAKDTWEDRLRKSMDRAEAAAAELDGTKAAANATLEARIKALHDRLAALEEERGLETPTLVLDPPKASSRLQVLSKAVVGFSGRLKRIDRHDHPPAVTPSPPSPSSPPQKAPAERTPPGHVQWPETLEATATASVDYESFGEWRYRVLYPTIYDRRHYHLLGYEGRFHFSLRLKGLLEQVKRVTVVIVVVGGTGPFRFEKLPRYEFEWKAARHMFNGALKQMVNYDDWSQNVSPRWSSPKKKGVLRPRLRAYVSTLTTQDGRVVTFKVPK